MFFNISGDPLNIPTPWLDWRIVGGTTTTTGRFPWQV